MPKIRRATPTDSAGILECLRAAFEPYRSSYPPEAFLDTVITPEALRHRLATMSLFVAVSESGEIVGTIACHVVDETVQSSVHAHEVRAEVHANEGHLRGMAVLASWQGSGLAEQLLRSAESELRARECSSISLDTTEPLVKAIRFYEKHGYRNSGKDTYFCGMRRLHFIKNLAQ
jgi:predicted N-acetyltransferase YhbS